MNLSKMLMASIAWSWAEFEGKWAWVNTITNVLSTVLWVALVLVAAAGSIYAVYVGIKMARADSQEQRDENRKRLVNIVVSIIAVIVLIIFFNTFLPAILTALGVGTDLGTKDDPNAGDSIATIVNTAKVFLHI